MAHNVSDVARFVVNYAADENVSVNNMKLQKVLYYLQGFSFQAFGKELFKEEIEAWPYGPVIKDSYVNFSMFGSNKIPRFNEYSDFYNIESKTEFNYKEPFDERTIDFLENITNQLLNYSAMQLVESSKAEKGPWKRVYSQGSGNIIPKEYIKDFFMG